MEFKLLPYMTVDGIPTLPDSQIRGIFDTIEDEELVKHVFPNFDIQDRDHFLYEMKYGGSRLYTVLDEQGEIGLIFWLNHFHGRTAYIHFCSFRVSRSWRLAQSKFAWDIIDTQWKDQTGAPLISTFIGITPKTNKAAIKHAEAMGFKMVGVIPNYFWNPQTKKFTDAVISQRGGKGENL